MSVELLTINREMPRFLAINLHKPCIVINELKKIVKDLKQKNPHLNNYCLMEVGFSPDKEISHMRLYFMKKSQ
ncbi:MAG: hypothetical protein WBJ30_11110 [Tepidanaerobacteraceae bacterium]|jgi:hypothetical protein|nr:hypothetical protein [Tepidanaerobacteraceae bacterium]